MRSFKILGILAVTVGLASSCSVKDAKDQKVKNKPMVISAKNKLDLNLASFRDDGRINIEKSKHGTFVALLWPKFEGSVTDQSKAFGELAAKLLDLVADAATQKSEGFKFEDASENSFEQFKNEKCQDFIWRDFVLGETFQDNFDPYLHILDDGIAAAPLLSNNEPVPHDLATYDFKIAEIIQGEPPVPGNIEEARKWITEGMLKDKSQLSRYQNCSNIRTSGLSAYDKSKDLLASASDNLVLIKLGINCYEKRKGEYEVGLELKSKDSNFITCKDFFTKQAKLETQNRVFSTLKDPDFSSEIHPNWIDTNDEGIESELSWGAEGTAMKIKSFGGLEYSSDEKEYSESEEIHPINDLNYNVETKELQFYLDNPNLAVRYNIKAKQIPLENSERAEFSGDIKASCIPNYDIEICRKSLNGHLTRGGLFMFKGAIR